MTTVYLGLGSNERPIENLQLGAKELAQRFQVNAISPVYCSKPLGFDGADFLNAVIAVETDEYPNAVNKSIEAIHQLAGRIRRTDKFVSRTLDIDLLLYGDEVIPALRIPRQDILEYSFVLQPLADIAPDLIHPQTGQTVAAHWAQFDKARHPLKDVSAAVRLNSCLPATAQVSSPSSDRRRPR